MKKEKLKGKDLINVGIYCAIYCVIMTAVSMLGFFPIMLPMVGVIAPIVCGVPMMLFMTKVKKFGMITIMAVIIGIFLFITGMGYWPVILGIVFGLLADLIARSGNYQSAKKTVLSNGVFHLMIFGNLVPLYLNPVGYFATRQGMGQEYVDGVIEIMQPWTAPVFLIGCFLGGIIGALLGKAVLKKHFVRAGIV